MKISFGGYLWRYALYFVLTVAAIYGVLTLMERFLPQVAAWYYGSGASTGINVAAVMLPGIYLGQKWVRTEGGPMPRGMGWALAFCGAVIALVLSGVMVAGLIRFDAPSAALWTEAREEPRLFGWIVFGTFVFTVLITRLGMWSAVRGELRRRARQG